MVEANLHDNGMVLCRFLVSDGFVLDSMYLYYISAALFILAKQKFEARQNLKKQGYSFSNEML